MPADGSRGTAEDRLAPGHDPSEAPGGPDVDRGDAAGFDRSPVDEPDAFGSGRNGDGVSGSDPSAASPAPLRPGGLVASAPSDPELDALLAGSSSLRRSMASGPDGGTSSEPPPAPSIGRPLGSSPDPDRDPGRDDVDRDRFGHSAEPGGAYGASAEPGGAYGVSAEPGGAYGPPAPGADGTVVSWADPDPATMAAPGDGRSGGGRAVGLPGPRARRGNRAGRRGVRVRQRLWSVDPWSVFKISALFYLCLFFILMVAGTLLWNVARSSGTIDQVESFVTRLGAYGRCLPEDELADGQEFDEDDDCPDGQVLVDGFALDDGVVFKAAALSGVVLAITGSAGNVLMTVLLNLINEVTGGLRYTIIKERDQRARRRRGGGGGGPPGSSLLARLRR